MSSKAEDIIRLARHFYPPKLIAPWVGVSQQYVRDTLCRARRHDPSIPHFDGSARRNERPVLPGQIVVGVRLMPLLEQEATRRGKSVSETARDIIEKGLLDGWARNDR